MLNSDPTLCESLQKLRCIKSRLRVSSLEPSAASDFCSWLTKVEPDMLGPLAVVHLNFYNVLLLCSSRLLRVVNWVTRAILSAPINPAIVLELVSSTRDFCPSVQTCHSLGFSFFFLVCGIILRKPLETVACVKIPEDQQFQKYSNQSNLTGGVDA